jgi:hypothetical protein
LGKSDVGRGEKEKKEDCPIHFFKKYSSMSIMYVGGKNKKNNNFKVLILLIYFSKRIVMKRIKTREFVNIQTMPKYI